MRHALLALIALLTLVPAAAAGPISRVDDLPLVTAARPLEVGLFVPQRGHVWLFLDVEQGAYSDLSLAADDACAGTRHVGANAQARGTPADELLPDEVELTVDCGVLEPGWYVVTVAVVAGAALVQLDAAGASFH